MWNRLSLSTVDETTAGTMMAGVVLDSIGAVMLSAAALVGVVAWGGMAGSVADLAG